MEAIRINKFIAKSGFCSRRKADRLIEEGKVLINGKQAKLGDAVSSDDTVNIGDHVVTIEGKQDLYLMFNKPYGVISTFDENADNSLLDYIDGDERVFYIGRLDVESTGLMLFTNNGGVANKITDANENHEKEYVVTVDKKITRNFLDAMRKGVMFDDRKSKPAQAKKVSDTRFKLIITEGRNRQVRKMCEALGYHVKQLKRTRVMNVKLGTLGEGNWRELTKNERRGLLNAL